MPYKTLGQRTVQGTSTDNIHWTVTFDPAAFDISTQMPQFEIYHTTISSVAGAIMSTALESWQWDAGIYGETNTDDPIQPMEVQPGQTVTYTFVYPEANDTPPSVTVWLRYDLALVTGIYSGTAS